MSTGLVKAEQLDSDILAIIKTGDLDRLNEQQQLQYYIYECNRIGLDPASRPFAWLRLKGKLVLYADRRCGDMLATKHGFTTEIVEGPCIKAFGDVSVLYCRARARGTNGRSVEDVGTLATNDIVNGVMKVLSKAVRRATLRLAGWGGLDESEVETIPAHAKESPVSIAVDPEPGDVYYVPSLDSFHESVERMELPGEAVALWIKHRGDIAAMPASDRKEVWKTLCARVEDIGRMSDGHTWLKEHIATEEARSVAMASASINEAHSDTVSVPQTIIDDVAQHESPLPLLAASAIWHHHALDGTLSLDMWSFEEKAEIFKYLVKSTGKNSSELQRTITFERWDLDIKAARSIDELRDIYTAAKEATKSSPWGTKTGPNALADLERLCGEKKAKLTHLNQPNGSGEPKLPMPVATDDTDADPEREAIQGADDIGTTAMQMLRAKLTECTEMHHFFNALFKHGPGAVAEDDGIRLAKERLVQLGKSDLTAVNMIRAEIRKRGWKATKTVS